MIVIILFAIGVALFTWHAISTKSLLSAALAVVSAAELFREVTVLKLLGGS